MVLAFAGDSTITRLVLPLVTAPFFDAGLDVEEARRDDEEAREVDFEVVFFVVAIFLSIHSNIT